MNQETSRTRNIERVKNKLKSHRKHCSSPLSEARVHLAQDLGQMQVQTLGYQILNGIGPPAFIKTFLKAQRDPGKVFVFVFVSVFVFVFFVVFVFSMISMISMI